MMMGADIIHLSTCQNICLCNVKDIVRATSRRQRAQCYAANHVVYLLYSICELVGVTTGDLWVALQICTTLHICFHFFCVCVFAALFDYLIQHSVRSCCVFFNAHV